MGVGADPVHVVGVDFGTLSGRAVVVRVQDGAELGSAVHEYAHGVIESTLPATGEQLPPQWALQDPDDYIEVLKRAVPQAIENANIDPASVKGIATDFTASTPMPVLEDGTPLCKLDAFATRPHAYVKLWKHHAAQPQAVRINELAAERKEPWLPRYGGLISSEWEFAKALQVLEEDPEVYEAMDRWVEAADWIVWQLCGNETRNACSAGYKAIRQDGRYPSRDYLRALNPDFELFVAEKIAGRPRQETAADGGDAAADGGDAAANGGAAAVNAGGHAADGGEPTAAVHALGSKAGTLTSQAAAWTGLPEGIAVAVGNVDAHVTAPAARAIDPGQMLLVMGTSTCHVMNDTELREVPGMCGVVDGGIVEGLYGYEAGQSAVGDIFGWFVETSVPPSYHEKARANGQGIHEYLSELAGAQRPGEHGLVALDWFGGNRSILVDHELSGLIVGQTLATKPEDTYRALIEATAFGTRVILEAFDEAKVPVKELFVAGGLLKNPVIMQIYADVTRHNLHLIESDQGPALGSAIHAAVAAGLHEDIHAAADAMGKVRRDAYVPDAERAEAYDALYAHYRSLHDRFADGALMHDLRRLRPRELVHG